jgi:enoyl-CoA hydratase/carnithine racemase
MVESITRFHTKYYDSSAGKIAIMTMDNGHDHERPNTFCESSLMSLNNALKGVMGQVGIKGLLLTGKPYVFATGAELAEVPFISTYEQGYQIGMLGHTVMKQIMDLPFPTLAAVNGVAMGSGLEIALYCDYRTVSKCVQSIGFPECSFGLIPGWGGCTLATKLLGIEKALELVVYNPLNQNRMIDARSALEMGLADRIFDGAEFMDESLRFLVDIIAGDISLERRPVPAANVDNIIAEARDFVKGKVDGAAIALYHALELIKGAVTWDVERGFEEENKALGDLIKSMQSKVPEYSSLLCADLPLTETRYFGHLPVWLYPQLA